MDLLTIIGNATVDKRFLNELFKNPLGTVERYGFQLTPSEQKGLRALTQGKHSTDNKNYLKEVYVCPKRPCVGIALPPPKEYPKKVA